MSSASTPRLHLFAHPHPHPSLGCWPERNCSPHCCSPGRNERIEDTGTRHTSVVGPTICFFFLAPISSRHTRAGVCGNLLARRWHTRTHAVGILQGSPGPPQGLSSCVRFFSVAAIRSISSIILGGLARTHSGPLRKRSAASPLKTHTRDLCGYLRRRRVCPRQDAYSQ